MSQSILRSLLNFSICKRCLTESSSKEIEFLESKYFKLKQSNFEKTYILHNSVNQWEPKYEIYNEHDEVETDKKGKLFSHDIIEIIRNRIAKVVI